MTVPRSAAKVALVTGAAGGIGRAICRRLAGEGWTLALADRDEAGLATLASSLGTACSVHPVDLFDPEAPERLFDEVSSEQGSLSLLVNNAGLTVLGALESQTRQDVERVFGVNLVAVAQLCRVFTPLLLRSAPAQIVNIASFAGVVAFPLQTVYSASKHGVRGLSHALRIELSDRDVSVSAVLPGTIATGLMKGATSYESGMAETFTDLMLRHGSSPDAVARAVLRCVHRRNAEIIVGWDAQLGIRAQRWMPSLVRRAFDAGWARYRRR